MEVAFIITFVLKNVADLGNYLGQLMPNGTAQHTFRLVYFCLTAA